MNNEKIDEVSSQMLRNEPTTIQVESMREKQRKFVLKLKQDLFEGKNFVTLL